MNDEEKAAKLAEVMNRIRTVNADGSITVSLSTPIKVEGKEVNSLTLVEPIGKHWRRLNVVLWQRGDGEAQLKAIEVLASIPPSSSEQLHGRDILKLTFAITPFFDDSPATGGAA